MYIIESVSFQKRKADTFIITACPTERNRKNRISADEAKKRCSAFGIPHFTGFSVPVVYDTISRA